MDPKGLPVCVVGAGSFGTALSLVLADGGCSVDLWGRSQDVVDAIADTRENPFYLPGVRLPEAVRPTTDLARAVRGKKIVLGVTPSHAIRSVFARARDHLDREAIVVCASKGIEADSLALVDEMVHETLPDLPRDRIMVLSGPSFAAELAKHQATAITLAAPNEELAREVQSVLMRPYLRVYTSPDVVGVCMGGAIKNVIAIAAGAAEGLDLGHNARAALVTRGLRELTRLAVARGGHPITLSGLAGLGDLVLTCTGKLSRNRSLGAELGRGRSLDEIVASTRMIAEGVRTTRSAVQLADTFGVEAPICREVHEVLYGGKPARVGLADLMNRPPRSEHEFAALGE